MPLSFFVRFVPKCHKCDLPRLEKRRGRTFFEGSNEIPQCSAHLEINRALGSTSLCGEEPSNILPLLITHLVKKPREN